MKQNRNYNCSDTEMLLASKTITKSLNDYLFDLSMVRSNLTEQYVAELNKRIDAAIEQNLGLDKKMELRNTTKQLVNIQKSAMRDLSFIKTQIEVDFGDSAAEINKTLGFTKHLKAVQNENQEALIELLYTFKMNMTANLKESIVEKGTNPQLIERIISYSDILKDTNVSQESLKGTSKTVTNEVVTIFNDIYKEIIGVCKIASNYYQQEPLVKNLFTFSQVVANMSGAKKTGVSAKDV